MYTIDYYRLIFFLFFLTIKRILSSYDDNHHLEIISRAEQMDVQFFCDLTDVAWWKRPNLLATRYGVILPKFRSKMSLERVNANIPTQILNIYQLQSNDSGVYECETLGAIRQYNLTVIVRLATVELGVQYDSINDHLFNQTHRNLSQQFFISNNRFLNLRENQFIRLTCVVSRALPAAILHFPFDVDYRIERNSTIENDDKTYRTILVLILRINRYFHQRFFHCEATQTHEQIRIRSNTLQIDVAYSPICSQKFPLIPQFYTGIGRAINLTCHMNNGNPARNNFTWHLPNGNIYLGSYLNITSTYLTLTPSSSIDFGQITCRAQNELGLTGECYINMSLGDVPDPIKSCHYTYFNSTLTVNCMPGFHQGDEEFFCYMYKRQSNGSYSEHARLKGNCAFILPDLKPDYHHDFRVFTKNKFGDNFDRSYSIQVGKAKIESLADKTRTYWPYMTLFTIGAFLASFVLICCLCYKVRIAMSKRRNSKGNFEDLTYHNHNSYPSHINSNGKTSLVHVKQNGNGTAYPVRPYRSKDYLISSEPSTLHRHNPPFLDDEVISNRRSIFKETDLDRVLSSSNGTMKTLPINRNRTLITPSDSPQEPSNPIPFTMQRRSSFQAATKLNSLDFYSTSEPLYFLDKQFIQSTSRNPYSSESEKRHNLIITNGHIDRRNSQNDQSITESISTKQESFDDHQRFILNPHDRHRDDGIFV